MLFDLADAGYGYLPAYRYAVEFPEPQVGQRAGDVKVSDDVTRGDVLRGVAEDEVLGVPDDVFSGLDEAGGIAFEDLAHGVPDGDDVLRLAAVEHSAEFTCREITQCVVVRQDAGQSRRYASAEELVVVDAQNGFETQDDLPMLIIVNGDGSSYPDGKFRLDDWNTATFSMDCAYGYTSHFESDALRLRFYLDGDRNISFWNDPSTKVWNIRIPTVGETKKDGGIKYKGTLSIVVGDVDFTTPIDKAVAEQKKVQYRRVLVPPQETGFDPSGWLAVCDDPDASRDDFIGLERLMDLRSHLYSLADRLRHREEGDDVAGGLVSTAYAALNGMDADGAQSAVASLDARMTELESADGGRRPLSDFSPYSWIKSFTQWGYVRSPDGHAYFEPNPWNLLWEDGFRCNVDQDPRVVIVETVTGRDFYETRYLEPMTGVSFVRDWVSTRWCFPNGKTVTFSLLTPVVDVDGVTELKMGGFSSAPDSVEMIDPQGRVQCIRLTEEAKYVPEVIPSALIDQTKPPPAARPPSKGVTRIDPRTVGRPWIRLNIPRDRDMCAAVGSSARTQVVLRGQLEHLGAGRA